MKKFLLILVLIVLGFTFSCKKDEAKPLKVILPSGTPLMAVAGLKDNSKFDFTVVNGQEPLQAAFLEGEYDLFNHRHQKRVSTFCARLVPLLALLLPSSIGHMTNY